MTEDKQNFLFGHTFLYKLKVTILNAINGVEEMNDLTYKKRVLILGSGFTNFNFNSYCTIETVGVDFSEKFIELANRNKNEKETFMLGDITKPLPFNPRSFDVVVLPSVIHHISADKHAFVIKQASEIAKEYVVIYDHILNDNIIKRSIQRVYWWLFDHGEHYNNKEEWINLLQNSDITFKRYGMLFENIIKITIKVE